MPGRKYIAGSGYRYGFNGQEKSDEIGDGLTTALFWEYDSRIVRRWNLDPKPNISIGPYSAFANNPIWNSDPLGDSIPLIKFSFGKFEYAKDGTIGGTATDMGKIVPNIAASIGNDAINLVNIISYNINEFDKRGLGGYINEVANQWGNGISNTVSSTYNYLKNTSGSQKLNDFSNFVGSPETWEAIGTGYVTSKFPGLVKAGPVTSLETSTSTAVKTVVTTAVEDNVALAASYAKNRPKFRQNVINKVWESAKDVNGKVFAPNTFEELSWDKFKSRYDQWHMGHKPGFEYRSLVDKLRRGTISKEQFLNEYNNPNNYRPESPAANMSHKYELPK